MLQLVSPFGDKLSLISFSYERKEKNEKTKENKNVVLSL